VLRGDDDERPAFMIEGARGGQWGALPCLDDSGRWTDIYRPCGLYSSRHPFGALALVLTATDDGGFTLIPR